MNTWIILPNGRDGWGYDTWVLFWLDRRPSKQDFARDKWGLVRTYTTRSGARGVRSRLVNNSEKGA